MMEGMSATSSMPKRPSDPLDLIDVDSLLSDEEKAIRAATRQVCADAVDPYVMQWYEDGDLPVARELAQEFGKVGLLGMHLEGYGCAGMSAVDYGLACLELEASDSGIRSLVSVQGSLAMFAIWRFGTEEHKQEWLPRMAAGEAIGCFGLTEPDHGSDPGSMRTRARRDGDDWVLNGSQDVDHQRLDRRRRGRLGQRGRGERRHPRLRGAHRHPGVRGPQDHPQDVAARVGHLRAHLREPPPARGCRVPRRHRAQGAARLPVSEARYGIVWGSLGAARSSLEAARRYSMERIQFGRPIAGFQLTQAKLANMATELQLGQLLALHLGRRKDTVGLRPEQVSVGKYNNITKSIEICRTARTILGANGVSGEYPVMRHANNLESVLTYEGTVEMHTLVIGQALTGESAFR